MGMKDISSDAFAMVCFTQLMHNFPDVSPEYMREKATKMLHLGFGAFRFLDMNNQLAVIEYLKKWQYNIPDEIQEQWQEALVAMVEIIMETAPKDNQN